MISYLFILLILFSFLILKKSTVCHTTLQRKVLDLFALLVLIFFSANSQSNGWDWYSYKDSFEQISKLEAHRVFLGQTDVDYFYGIVLWLVGVVSDNFQIVILVQSLTMNLLYYYGVKRFRLDFVLFAIIFFSTSFLRLELSTFRQGMAVAFYFYSLSLVYSEPTKKLKPVFFTSVACLFHMSALVGFLIMPFLNRDALLRKKQLVLIALAPVFLKISLSLNLFSNVLLVVRPFVGDFVYFRLRHYSEEWSINSPSLLIYLVLIQALFFIFFCGKQRDKLHTITSWFVVFNLVLTFYLAFIPAIIITRLSYYVSFSLFFVISVYFKVKRVTINKIFLLLFFTTFQLFIVFRDPLERVVYFPYRGYIESTFFGASEELRSRDLIESTANRY
ncbi:hypothetical protein BC469_05660 [Vibrio parahaemolyticus]|nr:EpsG family protein [Vibrio parahaemolyticus]ETT17296.1 putative membrane protein [Vibrio parahaemolyticus 50]OQK14113.1 hypothetical protein AKL19_06390 [Vibrio parahaemolyticus O4:K55 str. NY3547]EGR2290433.1 EpsG family protein [Vibrio parahaemolyticus]MCW8007827.1 hypothetical protein [Vibrio parahaemolyticus]